MRRRRILITGSSGGLGSALAQVFGKDHEIVQLDLREPADEAQRKLGAVLVGSITDPEMVVKAMDAVDTVIHNAAIPGDAKPYHRLMDVNVMGTFIMLDEAGRRKEVEQFIYISSICWHGITSRPDDKELPRYLPIDEAHPSLAVSYYACSKVQAEYWCETYPKRFGKPVVAVRPALIIPFHREPTYTARMAPTYPHLNDYVGMSDLVDGIARAMDYHPQDGFDRFLFHAVDQGTTTPSLELVEKYFPGVPIDREKLAAWDGFGALVDCTHAREKLNWRANYRCKR